jgi:hypothetical protein
MGGNDSVRYCTKCRKDVYNLDAMSTGEARRLIEKAEGRGLCLRLARRFDGTIVTGDCSARLRAARLRGPLAYGCALFAVLLVQIWAQAFGLRLLSSLLLQSRNTRQAVSEMDSNPPVHRTVTAPARRHRLPVVKHELGGI